MKKLIFLLLFCIIATSVMAQEYEYDEIETLLGDDISVGGFGSPVIKIISIKNKTGVMVGGQGNMIFNRIFSIGVGAYGWVNDTNLENIIADTTLGFDFGYGGIILEYIINPSNASHFTISTLIGAGGIIYEQEKPLGDFKDDTVCIVLESGINLELNVTEFLHIDLGTSYRYVNGVNFDRIPYDDNDFSGISANIIFKFGYFGNSTDID